MGEELEEMSNVSEDSEGMGWERARKVGTIGETGKGGGGEGTWEMVGSRRKETEDGDERWKR